MGTCVNTRLRHQQGFALCARDISIPTSLTAGTGHCTSIHNLLIPSPTTGDQASLSHLLSLHHLPAPALTMAFGKAALKFSSMLLYGLEFCCAALILGVYSYFLAVQADRDVGIPKWQQAVEGMSGAGVLYTILALVFVCCLGGKTLFAFIGVVMNLLFCGAFIAIAVLTRDGAHNCSGYVRTPLGDGDSRVRNGWQDQITYAVSLRTACRLNTACFAVAVAGA